MFSSIENAASQCLPSTGLLISIMGKIDLRIDLLDFFFSFLFSTIVWCVSFYPLHCLYICHFFSISIHATFYGNKMLSSTKFMLSQHRRGQRFSYFASLNHWHVKYNDIIAQSTDDKIKQRKRCPLDNDNSERIFCFYFHSIFRAEKRFNLQPNSKHASRSASDSYPLHHRPIQNAY